MSRAPAVLLTYRLRMPDATDHCTRGSDVVVFDVRRGRYVYARSRMWGRLVLMIEFHLPEMRMTVPPDRRALELTCLRRQR